MTLNGLPILLRAHVVVDSRNVQGQAARVLGRPALPRVDGIVAALEALGIQADTVAIGMASLNPQEIARKVSANRPGERAFAGKIRTENEQYRTQVAHHPRGHALAGYLKINDNPHGGVSFAEKQVDEHVAARVTEAAHQVQCDGDPATAILLLSDDTDLEPAIQLAEQWGVQTLRVTSSRVNPDRLGDRLQVDDRTLALMCGMPVARTGHRLRDLHATALTGRRRPAGWYRASEPQGLFGDRSGTVLTNRDGMLGVYEGVVRRDQTVRLFADGIDAGRDGGLFPLLRLSDTPTPPRGFRRGVVCGRDPDKLQVLVGEEEVYAACPPGLVAHGATVLLTGDNRYVGAIQPHSAEHPSLVPVRLEGTTRGSHFVGRSREGYAYTVFAHPAFVGTVGDWVLVHLAREFKSGKPSRVAFPVGPPMQGPEPLPGL